jgi:hypothetical protein
MPSEDCVLWLNNSSEIASKIEIALRNKTKTIKKAEDWFKIINLHPIENASNNIIEAINKIIK